MLSPLHPDFGSPGSSAHWPVGALERLEAVEILLRNVGVPLSAEQVRGYFGDPPEFEVVSVLLYLVTLGFAHEQAGRFQIAVN